MKYSELNKKAKENALIDYCDLMSINDIENIKKYIENYFIKYDRDIFLKNGFLKHKKRWN